MTVAGLPNKKIAFIIQARMRSTRLPGKILLPIPLGNGKPLLSWIIDELKLSKLNKEIIIATSLNAENDSLEHFCQTNNIQCFRGSEDDVLSRFDAILEQSDYECAVRLTADNPFLDISILDQTVEHHLNAGNDYTKTSGLPLGMNFEVVSSKALLSTKNYSLTDDDREHVTLFIKNNKMFKNGVYTPNINPELENLRLTVDYPSDFTLASAILSQCVGNDRVKGIELIEKTYGKYKWLFESNYANIQKKQYLDVNDEIKEASIFLENHDFKRAAKLLNKNAE